MQKRMQDESSLSMTDGRSTAAQSPKPLLTVSQQIAHMRAKGITFELVSEKEAAAHLRTKCQFFRIYAYRKNCAKCEGGARDGQYVNLDFGHLKALSNLDRKLRDVLLPMTLDVEHFAKVRLLAAAESNGEDGYTLMRDYTASVPAERRAYIERELEQRKDNPYSGDIVLKYRSGMPLWVFCEAIPFGTFLGIVKFCAARWEDDELLEVHYQLKRVKSIRNACAHGACIVNDLSEHQIRNWRPPGVVTKALASCGIPKRLRSKRLKNPRVAEICALLCLYNEIVPAGSVRTERERALMTLFRYLHEEGSFSPRRTRRRLQSCF